MLYILTRIIISSIVAVIIVLLMRKFTKAAIKTIRIICICIWIVIIGALSIWPFENYYLVFSTPEEVFEYSHSGKIVNIREGEESCRIEYVTRGTASQFAFFYKTSSGYKIGTSLSSIKVLDSISNEVSIKIHQTKGTQDYYLDGYFIIEAVSEEKLAILIEDSVSSRFEWTATPYARKGEYLVRFGTYIENFEDDYYLIVNGEKII